MIVRRNKGHATAESVSLVLGGGSQPGMCFMCEFRRDCIIKSTIFNANWFKLVLRLTADHVGEPSCGVPACTCPAHLTCDPPQSVTYSKLVTLDLMVL